MDLKGAVALVTGGNGGLGQRICHALAQEGAHIAVMYARSRDQAEGVASDLASRYQDQRRAFACDITDGAAVDRLVGEVTQAFGRLDVLINDAAYNISIPFSDLDSLTLGGLGQDHGHQPDGADAPDQGGSPVMKAQGTRPHRQHRFGRRAQPDRLLHRLCRVEGGAYSSDEVHGGGAGARDARQLRGAGSAGGHAARQPICGPSRSSAPHQARCLKKAADKDDCADMVVAMCRTETMTGQTVVIDSGRIFH
jgi:3-oxoacyl-[acyl-carrier protein] reductase